MKHRTWMAIARAQAGVISRAQLIGAGLTDRQVDGLVRSGAVCSLGFGLWRVAGAPASRQTSLWRAVLATRGVLVASSAVYLWHCEADLRAPIEVAVRRSAHNRIPTGVRVHRWLGDRAALTTRYGLPVTPLPQSVIDYLASLPWPAAMAFADRAFNQGWIDPEQIERRLQTSRPGNGVLRRILATHRAGAEAESERRLHRLLHRSGLTGWVANYRVAVRGRIVARVDVGFPLLRLAIEVDGLAYHSDRDRFQRDRTRQNELMLLGWTVLRFTWFDLIERPDQVIDTIADQLQRMVS
ncbi:MAG: DUF559 domain-containing protein [Jatrophihabitantaceae bacterium]